MKAVALALIAGGGFVQMGGIVLYVMRPENGWLVPVLGFVGGGFVEGVGVLLLLLARSQSE